MRDAPYLLARAQYCTLTTRCSLPLETCRVLPLVPPPLEELFAVAFRLKSVLARKKKKRKKIERERERSFDINLTKFFDVDSGELAGN